MRILKIDNFANTYKKYIKNILFNYEFETSTTLEIHNFGFVLNDIDNILIFNKIRSINLNYLKGELIWYLSGRRDLEFIHKYSKFWDHIANTDNTLNSAYGYLIFVEKNKYGFSQWKWAKNSLIKFSETRQAMLFFNKPNYFFEGNKDFICTQYGIFHIRNNKLYFTIHMRSSDSKLGIIYDIPFFTLLHKLMLFELQNIYKNLKLGTFEFITNSAHIYKKDIDLFQEMIKYDFTAKSMPKITINPILHPDLLNTNISNDKFINWLKEK